MKKKKKVVTLFETSVTTKPKRKRVSFSTQKKKTKKIPTPLQMTINDKEGNSCLEIKLIPSAIRFLKKKQKKVSFISAPLHPSGRKDYGLVADMYCQIVLGLTYEVGMRRAVNMQRHTPLYLDKFSLPMTRYGFTTMEMDDAIKRWLQKKGIPIRTKNDATRYCMRVRRRNMLKIVAYKGLGIRDDVKTLQLLLQFFQQLDSSKDAKRCIDDLRLKPKEGRKSTYTSDHISDGVWRYEISELYVGMLKRQKDCIVNERQEGDYKKLGSCISNVFGVEFKDVFVEERKEPELVWMELPSRTLPSTGESETDSLDDTCDDWTE